jgi:Uma2 family endonuclease
MSQNTVPLVPVPAITPPPRSSGITPHRWTIAEYRELHRTGLFHNVKTMLIRGELFTMTMPKPPHDTSLSLMYEALRGLCPANHYVRNQQGFDIGSDNDPGPDLAIVPGSIRDYANSTPTVAALIVEIADSSLKFDTTTKAELYATAKVPEYWVLDIENRQLIVFRDPRDLAAGLDASAYGSQAVFAAAARVSPLCAPQASVAVADLLV